MMIKITGKKWLTVWVVTICIFTLSVAIFNYTVDPMWLFGHSNSLNSLQEGFDEKKLKTIYLKNHKNKFDSLLIGSSRLTYYNENDFELFNVFNYSFSGSNPVQLIDFVNYFKSTNTMENLIIGFDFFGSMTGGPGEEKKDRASILRDNKDFIKEIEDTNKFLYFLKNYMTMDMIGYSRENIRRSLTNKTGKRSYNRQNVVSVDKVEEKVVYAKGQMLSRIYYLKYKTYDPDFKKTIKQIKQENIRSNLIIFTTPLAEPFLNEIFTNDKLKKCYVQWIRDLVDVYGKVYFGTYYNDLAKNYARLSIDGHHYYPYVGKHIIQDISDNYNQEKNSNIFLFLTKNNVEEYIEQIIPYRVN